MPKLIDLTGQQFTRLTVKHREGSVGPFAAWRCVCSCGNETVVSSNALRRGNTKSCGCLNLDRLKETKSSHGETRLGKQSPEYITWCAIKQRCYNPKATGYANYGGRGISVCDAWKYSFETFLKDMGRKPTAKHSIERIDNSGNYSPENCVWASKVTQNRNTRNSIVVEIEGVSKTVMEWAEQSGVKYATVLYRIHRGWDAHKAVFHKVTPLEDQSSS